MSTVVMSLLFEICRLYGGFFTSPMQLKSFENWRFLDTLSYIKYAFVGVALNELHGLELDCDSGSTCLQGGDIVKLRGYDEYSIGFCAGILVLYTFVCRLIAYLGLKYIRN